MDRPTTRTESDSRSPRIADRETLVLPSRQPAMDACRGAIEAGPVLLTGEAGIGKTWLWRSLGAETPPWRRWLAVDLTPADGPADFYRLVGHGLGLIEPDRATSRVELVDFLAERHKDGERPVLVVEEAHNLSAAVWEEVRILANRLGEPGGFAGLVLVGQTSLARRFSTRPMAGIEARLAARSHLGPIDADEALELLTRLRPDRSWTLGEVESYHRDAAGNPGRLLRRVGPASASRPRRPRTPPEASPVPVVPPPRSNPPLLGMARPPLIIEDDLIEVGWSPEADTLRTGGVGPAQPGGDSNAGTSEEEVRDHYAALQAWREWSENQVRQGLAPQSSTTPADPAEVEDDGGDAGIARTPDGKTTLWVDGEQAFAPYGQLFSKLAQARDPD